MIEDDEHVRRMVTKVLQSDGCEVEAPATADADLVRRDRPRLVVTDIFMPENEGIETIA